jgi:hypothetical protein
MQDVQSRVRVTNAQPDKLDIWWLAGPCVDSGFVTVDGAAQDIEVEIRLVRSQLECPAEGFPYRLTLDLTTAVSASDVSASVTATP